MDILKLNDVPPPKPQPEDEDQATREAPQPVAQIPPAAPALDTSALTAPPSTSDSPPAEVEADPLKTLEFTPKIIEQVSTVYDPEIPVNIYELGLIYEIAVDQDSVAVIKMTLTAPGCPAAVTLPAEVLGKVKSIEGIADARIDLVWEPPWTKDRMTEAAKLQLGIFD